MLCTSLVLLIYTLWVKETIAMPLDIRSLAQKLNAYGNETDWEPSTDVNKTIRKYAKARCDRAFAGFENDTYF